MDNVSLIDLALEYGIDLIEQVGGDYICLCPFHDDKETPSLRIYSLTNSFHCFGCDKGTSIFDFVMLQESINFQEALYKLAARVGYAGTYTLKKIKMVDKSEKFLAVREKIELAILKKYLDIYKDKKKLNNLNKDVYKEIELFWKWYDSIQTLFDKKIWKGVDMVWLEQKLYDFYRKALQKLTFLDKERYSAP